MKHYKSSLGPFALIMSAIHLIHAGGAALNTHRVISFLEYLGISWIQLATLVSYNFSLMSVFFYFFIQIQVGINDLPHHIMQY